MDSSESLPEIQKNSFYSALSRLFPWLVWLIATLPLAVLVYIGTYARYIGDDYSTASIVKTIGFWGSQTYWYKSWTGAYTYTFLTSFVGLFGVASVAWLQAICL